MAGAGNMSREQANVLKLIDLKYSVFLTGRGGSGKSFLLKKIVNKESDRGGCVVTGSTGIAAANIEGITLHSFAGIGTGTKSAHELLGIVLSNEQAVQRWKECRLLIVDEISMIGSALFEKLDFVARGTRQSSQPFGGIQLLLAGDFSQLPPASKESGVKQKYCFHSPLWKKCLDFSVELTSVYRQNEHALLNLLEDVRNGQICITSRNLLNQLTCELPCHPLDKVRLFPHKEDAAKANDKCLDLLPGETFHFQSRDAGEKSELDKR
jgi:ATP-dependent DNA helicase PIF1